MKIYVYVLQYHMSESSKFIYFHKLCMGAAKVLADGTSTKILGTHMTFSLFEYRVN